MIGIGVVSEVPIVAIAFTAAEKLVRSLSMSWVEGAVVISVEGYIEDCVVTIEYLRCTIAAMDVPIENTYFFNTTLLL